MNIKYNIWFLLFVWALFGISCYDDKGNYDYTPVKETYVTEGIDLSYTKGIGDVLEIIPAITNGGDSWGDTSRYEYWWTAQREIFREGEDNTQHVIGHGSNLYYQITLPKLTHGDRYLLTLHMKDKKTGVDWTKTTLLTLTGTLPEGWLLLCDEDGRAGLNMYAKKSDGSMLLIRDLLKYSTNSYLRGPRKVVYEKTVNEPGRIWILTDAGTTYIDKTDYIWMETQVMKYLMAEVVDDNYTCEDILTIAGGGVVFQMMEDGSGVQSRTTAYNGGVYQGNIAVYQDGTRFPVAPYFGHGQMGNPAFSSILLYDTDHEQFVSCGAPVGQIAKYCTALTPEDSWKIGRKMLYMQNALAKTYALFEEEGSNDILQCTINFTMQFVPPGSFVAAITMGEKKTLAGASHLKNARMRVYQSTKGYLYYVEGNTLYTWDGDHEQALMTFDEEVTALHSQQLIASGDEATTLQEYLLVATYAPDAALAQEKQGSLYFYSVDNASPVNIREANRVTGVGKVIDIDYQEKK